MLYPFFGKGLFPALILLLLPLLLLLLLLTPTKL